MDFSNLTPEFVSDLIELTSSLTNLPKRGLGKAKTYHFHYVLLDDILAKIKQNANFAIMTPLGMMEDGRGCVQCVLIHKSGQLLVSEKYPIVAYSGIKQGRDDRGNVINIYKTKQEEGAEITYTRRYAISSFLGIASEEDTDGPPMPQQNLIQSRPPQQRPAVRPTPAIPMKPASKPVARPTPAPTPKQLPPSMPAGTPAKAEDGKPPASKRQQFVEQIRLKLDWLEKNTEYERGYFINRICELTNEHLRWFCSEDGYNEGLCLEAIRLLNRWTAQVNGRKRQEEAAKAEDGKLQGAK